MYFNLNESEQRVWLRRDIECDKFIDTQDLIFVYPSKYIKNIYNVAERLQSAMEYLKYITNLNPTHWFNNARTVIGYKHDIKSAYWSSNDFDEQWLNIPWKMNRYLIKEDEPFDVCSHELVHPFYRISPLHNSNETWGQYLCELLRGPVKNVMGLNGNKWWYEKIEDCKSGRQNWGNVAGQFILRAKERYGKANETDKDFVDRFIEDSKSIKEFVASLFIDFCDRPFSTEFQATSKPT